ncbi:MAG: hypothetical protein LUF87_08100 [Alistipes sp.]|nr:hypothetical protein [Alistipes sp.]
MGRILKLLAPLSVILPMIAGCAPISRYPGPSVSPEHDHAEYWFYNPAGGEQPGMIPVKFMRRYFKTGGNGLPEPRRPVAGRFTIWYYDHTDLVVASTLQDSFSVNEYTERGLHHWTRSEYYDNEGNIVRVNYDGTVYNGTDRYYRGTGYYRLVDYFETDVVEYYSGELADHPVHDFRGEDDSGFHTVRQVTRLDDRHIRIHTEKAYIREEGWIEDNRKSGWWNYYDSEGELLKSKKNRKRKKDDVRFPHRFLR